MAQKYHRPIWQLPSNQHVDPADKATIGGNRQIYEATLGAYQAFANDFMNRVSKLDE